MDSSHYTSVFTSQLSSPEFWRKPSHALPSANEIQHVGTLFTMRKDGEMKGRLCVLTDYKLITVEIIAGEKVACWEGDLRWVLLTPFQELRSGVALYGFRLIHNDDFKDFYVSDREDLDTWLSKLEPKTILTHIEDDYIFQGSIGKGGQSEVLAGIDKSNGKSVAIKRYEKRTICEDRKKVSALVNEIEILRRLKHSDIVELYKVYESQKHVYLILEYIPGPQLLQSLRTTGKYTESEAKLFLSRLLDVLSYLSQHRVIHRDIKPENIILTSPTDRTRFKLIDFGLSMQFEGVEICDSSGSPGYFAPEILMKRKHGPKVDVYTAGILMYTLLVGVNPFVSETREETIRKNCVNDISFGADWKGIHPKLICLIKVMTNFNPENRMNISDLQTWLKRDFNLTPNYHIRRASLNSDLETIYGDIANLEKEMKDAKKGAISALEAAQAFHRRQISHG